MSGSAWRGGRRRQRLATYLLAVGALAAVPAAAARTAGVAAVPSPASVDLLGVSCASAGGCVAVGEVVDPTSTAGLVERWNGTGWVSAAIVRVPSFPFVILEGVSCVRGGRCFAAGYAQNRTGSHAVLAVGAGARWSLMRGAAAGSSAALLGIACAGPDRCLAVGRRTDALGNERPLAELWNGGTWSLSAPAQVRGAVWSRLTAVACPSVSRCAVTGTYQAALAAGPGAASMAEWWQGGHWRATPVAAPLTGVACPTASTCLALGESRSGAGRADPVLVRSSGGGWTTVGDRTRPRAADAGVAALACPSADACLAVGARAVGSRGNEAPSSERWDGARWTVLPMPGPVGSDDVLVGVSCSATSRCVAVGTYQRGAREQGLTELWDGRSWAWGSVSARPG